ncbi:MAG: hypothetical protein ACD_73C00185G0002 [uncultured bacterium]|nr:MAG: hypothetical protein ACD_73C00185G0002 [uncultured bacterium]
MKRKTIVYCCLAIFLAGVHCGGEGDPNLNSFFDEVPNTIPNEALFGDWDLQVISAKEADGCEGMFDDNLFHLKFLTLKKLSEETSTEKGNCTVISDPLSNYSDWAQIDCKVGGNTLESTINIQDSYSGCNVEEVTDLTFKMTDSKAAGNIHVSYHLLSGTCSEEMKKAHNCLLTIDFKADKKQPSTPSFGAAKKGFNESCQQDKDCQPGLLCTCQENAPCDYGLCRIPCAPNDTKQNNCEAGYYCADNFCFTKDEISKAISHAFDDIN